MPIQGIRGLINRVFRRSNYLPSHRRDTGARKRLLIASSISLLLHGGAGTIVGITQFSPEKKSPSSIAAEEVTPKPAAEEVESGGVDKAALLAELRAEKELFIQELLLDLNSGQRSISMSEFAIRSEVLDRNIAVLESEQGELIDGAKIQERYKTVFESGKRWVKNSQSKEIPIEKFHHFNHYRMFRTYFKDSGELLDVFVKRYYNCASSTKFLTVLEDDILASENFGVVVLDPPKDPSKGKSGHLRSWFRDQHGLWQIENTDGAPPRKVPFTKGLRTPKEIFIAAYLINNGIKVKGLPKSLAQYYKKGVSANGFPVARVSTDLPDPPDHPIPNPYFGILHPKSVSSKSQVVAEPVQPVKTEKLIEEARIEAIILALNPKYDNSSNSLHLSIINIPEEVDWCEVAESTVPSKGKSTDYELKNLVLNSYFAGSYPTFSHFRKLQYLSATRMAKMHSNPNNNDFLKCSPQEEYSKFLEDVDEIIRIGPALNEEQEIIFGGRLLRGLVNPNMARKELHKIFDIFGLSKPLGIEAMSLLATITSPEDFDFFKGQLLEEDPDFYLHTLRIAISGHALINMAHSYEKKDKKKILIDAYDKEPHYINKAYLLMQLGKLGYGIESLSMAEDLLPIIQDNYQNPNIDTRAIAYKRWITFDVSGLHPEKITDRDIQMLKNMIEKEEDVFVKANLIAVLNNEGYPEEAFQYSKTLGVFELEKYYDKGLFREQFILSLGEIRSPEIERMLVDILYIHPDLVTSIGEVYTKQGYRSEELIEELERALDNELLPLSERKHAALLLVQMGEL